MMTHFMIHITGSIFIVDKEYIPSNPIPIPNNNILQTTISSYVKPHKPDNNLYKPDNNLYKPDNKNQIRDIFPQIITTRYIRMFK